MGLRQLGYILFAVGLLVSVVGAAKAPAADTTWPDTWPLFLGGWIVSCIGVVIWRLSLSAAEEDYTTSADALAILHQLNKELQSNYESWKGATDCRSLNESITRFQEQYVNPFALNRNQFVSRLGMEAGAEIIITCSYGERMLNRVWSATADEHLPEALASLAEAREAFSLAVQQLVAAEEKSN